MNKRFLIQIIGLFLLQTVLSQEFVVIRDTVEWTMESTHGYFFYVQPYMQKLPQNWKSPYDYYNGQFYFRYEIISESTSEPCGIQFGIWQYRINPPVGEKYYSETMASIEAMSGPGSVVYSNGSPNSWWKSYEGVDFTRVSDFWRLGINIWSLDPRSVIANANWGGLDALWAIRAKWFPIKVYVIVIAVAQGNTFSGWDYYLSETPSAPNYGIDFMNERTDKIVPNTDEYAYNSNMIGAIIGNGIKLALIPGQDVYFRKKAQDNIPASDIQHLDVPSRPAEPTFSVNFINEKTTTAVSSEYKYSSYPDMSAALSGGGQPISITPGNPMYFQLKAKNNAFASEIQSLHVPERPVISSTVNTTTNNNPFFITIEFEDLSPVLTSDDFFIENCSLNSVESTVFEVTPIADGDVKIVAKPNAIEEGNFSSDTFKIYYTSIISDIKETHQKDDLNIYPHPASGYVTIYSKNNVIFPLSVSIVDLYGREVFYQRISEYMPILLDEIISGSYILIIKTYDNLIYTKKLIIDP